MTLDYQARTPGRKRIYWEIEIAKLLLLALALAVGMFAVCAAMAYIVLQFT